VAGSWRRLHSEELRNLYSSLNIIRVIKSRSMRWAEHVARVGKRNAYILFGRPRSRWEGNIILDLTRRVGRYGLESSGSEYGPVSDSCEN
jgi:hypothetical protein